MTLKILTIPNPILRQKSKPVKAIDSKVEKFIKDLEQTLAKKKRPSGIGLSAPQVGKLWRIFSTNLPPGNVSDRKDLTAQAGLNEKDFVVRSFINPTIVTKSKELTLGDSSAKGRSSSGRKKLTLGDKPFKKSHTPRATRQKPILEGCLSIPTIYGPVYRHEWVELKYTMIQNPGSMISRTDRFSGFTARVIQHELDHLNGILFTDRSIKQKLPLYEEHNDKLRQIEMV